MMIIFLLLLILWSIVF